MSYPPDYGLMMEEEPEEAVRRPRTIMALVEVWREARMIERVAEERRRIEGPVSTMRSLDEASAVVESPRSPVGNMDGPCELALEEGEIPSPGSSRSSLDSPSCDPAGLDEAIRMDERAVSRHERAVRRVSAMAGEKRRRDSSQDGQGGVGKGRKKTK